MWGKYKICKNCPEYLDLPIYDKAHWKQVKACLSSPIKSIDSLTKVLIKISGRFKLDFESLPGGIKLFGEKLFFDEVLPFLTSLIFETEKVFGEKKIKILRQFSTDKISFTKKEIAVLMANAFFSTFNFYKDQQNMHYSGCFNNINFWSIFNFESKVQPIKEKIKMFLHYFHRLSKEIPEGTITISRVYKEIDNSVISTNNNELCEVKVYSDRSIDSFDNHTHVDFANMLIGGGALNCGLVQEEIYFCQHPELCVAMLVCPCMTNLEVILIKGSVEKYCVTAGYGWGLVFKEPFKDKSVGKYDLLAMDALSYFAMESKYIQWEQKFIDRDIWKSYLGFKNSKEWISTGNWGCGAFGGDKEIKFVEQWISASVAQKKLTYCTFEKETDELKKKILKFINFIKIKKIKTRELYKALLKVKEKAKELKISLDDNTFKCLEKIIY